MDDDGKKNNKQTDGWMKERKENKINGNKNKMEGLEEKDGCMNGWMHGEKRKKAGEWMDETKYADVQLSDCDMNIMK